MPYNKETGDFEIDYDSFSSLNTASDNVLRYLFYYKFIKEDSFPKDVAQLRAILKGQDCSRNAKVFLYQSVEGKDLPPKDFDILSDEICKNEHGFMEDTETHTGKCILGDLIFKFEYEIVTDIYNRVSRRIKKVILEDDDFVVKDLDLIEACKSYFILKKQAIEEENRRKSFSIVSDHISKTSRIKPGAVWYTIEYHTGICTFGDLTFKFEYQSDNAPLFAGLNRDKKKRVVLEGDDFVAVSEESIYDACKSYFEQKQIALEKKRLKEATENEEKIWIEFRRKHKQELIDWLSPSLEGCPIRVCPRKRWEITNGVLKYSAVVNLERGICSECTASCRFPILIPEGKDHSDKWYELGLDKLDFKYL